jgi:hypothetical protein
MIKQCMLQRLLNEARSSMAQICRKLLCTHGSSANLVHVQLLMVSELLPSSATQLMRCCFGSCSFTGSAGTAVVTADQALLWTDGRYFLQAESELGPEWTLMRGGTGSCPEVR